MKAAKYTGIKQSNFINMLKHAYRNTSDTFLHAFLTFDSISKH